MAAGPDIIDIVLPVHNEGASIAPPCASSIAS